MIAVTGMDKCSPESIGIQSFSLWQNGTCRTLDKCSGESTPCSVQYWQLTVVGIWELTYAVIAPCLSPVQKHVDYSIRHTEGC